MQFYTVRRFVCGPIIESNDRTGMRPLTTHRGREHRQRARGDKSVTFRIRVYESLARGIVLEGQKTGIDKHTRASFYVATIDVCRTAAKGMSPPAQVLDI